jgi:hypothetical protein
VNLFSNFWDFVWLLFWTFAFVAYLFAIFAIIGDLFRDHKTSGVLKALWVIFLIFVPFLAALIYLIARGKSMAERSAAAAADAEQATNAYIRQVATTGASPAEEIGKAKALLDSGSITQAEYDALKAKALA